jgi:outer membrane protein assembly factor BamA
VGFVLAATAAADAGTGTGNTSMNSDTTEVSQNGGFFDRLSRPKMRAWGFVYLPKVYYGSETGVGFGGQILRPFSLGKRTNDSDIGVGGRFMAKGQGTARVTVNLGGSATPYSAKTKLEFTNIPRRFYGIGPDTPGDDEEVFQRQSLLYYLEVFRHVVSHLRLGVRGELEAAQLLETKRDGLLETLPIAGVERSSVTGWGILAEWDSRDDRYWPTRGAFHQSFFMKFDDGAGSDHNFDVYYVELRHYLTTAPNHVLALQAFLYATEGAPPFWRMAEMGGRAHSRGYERGRYRHRVIVALQAEHRFAVWRRLGLVGFAGLADVASRLEQMQLEHMRPTLGGGVRFRVGGDKERINARLDVAYGNEFKFYFKLGESF